MSNLLERCIKAGEVAGAACEMVLASDESYTNPGTEPYTKTHLALVSCASVCSLLRRALREADGDLELVRWCAEICTQCAAAEALAGVSDAVWTFLVRSCAACAAECAAAAERISSFTQEAFGATRDTDFQTFAEL